MKPLSVQFGRYRFAPGLWPSLAFLVIFPSLLALGFWQTQRAGDKQALVERRAASEVTAPLTLRGDVRITEDDRYRPAQVAGRYHADQQWLLDNRVHRGQPGYHVFTPFVIDGEDRPALLVNRGWVSTGASRAQLPELPVPRGRVALTGRLDAPASVGLVVGEVPLQSVDETVLVQALDLDALARARGLELLPYALVLDEGGPGGLQYDWSPIPQMGPEKHLGYAVQWFGLAVALLIIFVGVNTHRDRPDGGSHARV